MKKKILFLMQLPPPIHGASAVNKSILDSVKINSEFNSIFLNISPAKELSDIGKITLRKAACFINILFSSIRLFLFSKPDLVYITLSPHGMAFYKDSIISIIIKTLGGNVVYHLHGKGIKRIVEGSFLKKMIYKFSFKNANVIHLSEHLYTDIDAIIDKKKKLFSVSNGIKENKQETPPKSIGRKTSFVFLSNFTQSKGPDKLIEAAYILESQGYTDFEIKLIGSFRDDNFETTLRNLVSQQNSVKVEILGPLYGKDKFRELAACDVFVLPTENDCFPLSILEAMSMGLAVISTKEGAIPEIVDHGVTGELISLPTPEALAKSMLKFIKNPSYTAQCGKAGYAKFESRYKQEHFENNLASTLHELSD